jgi:hypothetical protein
MSCPVPQPLASVPEIAASPRAVGSSDTANPCLRAGAVYLPLNSGYTPNELRFFVGDAEPRLFVVAEKNRAAIAAGIVPGVIIVKHLSCSHLLFFNDLI